MSAPSSSVSAAPHDSMTFEETFKQFALESERVEMSYRSLEGRFQSVHLTLQEFHTRLAGKLAELDFVSRYLEAILDHMSQGIIFIDLNGIVTTYNLAAQKMLQLPEKDLLFHPFSQFFEDAFLGFSLQEAFAAKECSKTGYISRIVGGSEQEWEVEAAFVAMSREAYPLAHRDASSRPVQGLLVLLRDMTHVRRLQQMANRHDRLKELGELAAHLAHEIRNPLGGIKGFANLLQQELSDKPDLQQMAAYIAQGADALNHCVSQVLLYARPVQVHIESVDLIRLIEELHQFIQADSAWNTAVHFALHSSVPKLCIPLDQQLLKAALLNLFVNALQAMPAGGSLTVDVEPAASWVTLRVEDTGTGISPENLPKIFSPFFTTKAAGNGLGLAEVNKVIQAHQGWIEVKSEVGKGTVFTIKLPVAR